MKNIINCLVENQPGVLARIVGLISGRGYNIDTLNVGPTQDPKMSRMTVVVQGDDTVLEQVTKQLNKLVDVIDITDFKEGGYVDRELVLLRLKVDSGTRPEVIQICEIFRAQIVDVQVNTLTVELTGDEAKIARFIKLMENFGILELNRTGRIAMKLGEGG